MEPSIKVAMSYYIWIFNFEPVRAELRLLWWFKVCTCCFGWVARMWGWGLTLESQSLLLLEGGRAATRPHSHHVLLRLMACCILFG